jgi:hypothetical protein
MLQDNNIYVTFAALSLKTQTNETETVVHVGLAFCSRTSVGAEDARNTYRYGSTYRQAP